MKKKKKKKPSSYWLSATIYLTASYCVIPSIAGLTMIRDTMTVESMDSPVVRRILPSEMCQSLNIYDANG